MVHVGNWLYPSHGQHSLTAYRETMRLRIFLAMSLTQQNRMMHSTQIVRCVQVGSEVLDEIISEELYENERIWMINHCLSCVRSFWNLR